MESKLLFSVTSAATGKVYDVFLEVFEEYRIRNGERVKISSREEYRIMGESEHFVGKVTIRVVYSLEDVLPLIDAQENPQPDGHWTSAFD